jgi:hypothetical protein
MTSNTYGGKEWRYWMDSYLQTLLMEETADNTQEIDLKMEVDDKNGVEDMVNGKRTQGKATTE